MKPSVPEFERLEQTFLPTDPSEVHGMLYGLLCSDYNLSEQAWLAQIQRYLPGGKRLNYAARDALLELFASAVFQLNDLALEFYPLLPADHRALSRRVESLGAWCQGFLAGLGLGGLRKEQALIAEVQEFLSDLAAIARVGVDKAHAVEEDEIAYMEIVEYIRIGVLLISQVLRPAQARAAH